jgi:hypothetical protein
MKTPEKPVVSCAIGFYEKGVETCIKHGNKTVDLLELASRFKRHPDGEPEFAEESIKRGVVSGWSKHSRIRLRNFLLTHSAPGDCFAVTLTVPGDILDSDSWFDLSKRFWSRVQKLGYPSVWRIELQERKQPHLHVVTFGSGSGESMGVLWRLLVRDLPPVSFRSKSHHVVTCSRMALDGAFEHCVIVEPCEGSAVNWWRYLCDHTSKRKQVQLGWKGRQWGVVHRKGFNSLVPDTVSLNLSQWFQFMRLLRRLTKSKVWRGSTGKSVWFSNPDTVRRIVEHVTTYHYSSEVPF